MAINPSSRRAASISEAKALAHPLRAGILNLLATEPATVSAIGRALATNPGTVLHHLRILVAEGFAEASPTRTGKRGSTELPYASTQKARSLSFRSQPDAGESVGSAIMTAGIDGYYSAAPSDRFGESLSTFHLSIDQIEEFRSRIYSLAAEFQELRDADNATETITLMWVFFRQSDTAGATNDA